MNIIERHICAYIVECLTGIPGKNPERTYEVLEETQPKDEIGLLNDVHRVALEGGIRKRKTKGLVAAIVQNAVLEYYRQPPVYEIYLSNN